MSDDTLHVVMFSGGIGSWYTAKRVCDRFGPENVVLLFSDVRGENPDNPHIGEDEDTYRFVEESAAKLGAELVKLVDGRNIWEVFKDKRFLGNSRLAPCSHELKQKPAKKWIHENCDIDKTIIYVGIDWSESHRMKAVTAGYAPWKVEAPLMSAPFLKKEEMIKLAELEGIAPPRLYAYGFKHNNCGGGCVRAGQGQFKHLLDVMPERYAEWEKQEEKMQDFLGAEVTILKRQVKGKTVPLSLRELREINQEQPALIDMTDEGFECNCTSSWFADAEEE
jgi:hypothetical protein